MMKVKWENMEMVMMQARGLLLTRRSGTLRRAKGKAYGLFSEEFMLRRAGQAQIEGGNSSSEWQIYTEETGSIVSPTGSVVLTRFRVMQPPYGDDPRDQMWIKAGFIYYTNRKK